MKAMSSKMTAVENLYSQAISRHRRVVGGVFVGIGYILSPASWWNDAVVNIPIAYLIGWLVSRIAEPLFLPIMLLAYWGTNVLGIVMMHVGATYLLRKELTKKHWNLRRTLTVTAIYSIIMLALAIFGLIPKPF
ncbi:MAG: hypothetical protein C4532_02825 [Candidatus Abyssobacteria bacterium SURF_17]|uniref:Uncharacterized protein n=1 Tax=Candidatus Abyssobacteria bacterium SURF_17 TaxID=2093361 RepID=A0A419F7I4_9BACT|nr:MAG: hypothetical protein C4532_02825 [Candidatus Abyssubacteria bacterium SURF_17]